MPYEDFKGQLLFVVNKPMIMRAGLIFALFGCIFGVVGTASVIYVSVGVDSPNPFFTERSYMCFLIFIIIAFIIFIALFLGVLRLIMIPYMLKLYEKGIMASIRRTGTLRAPPVGEWGGIFYYSPVWEYRYNEFYIPLENIIELYFVPIKYTKNWTIVVKLTNGSWHHLFTVPPLDMDPLIDNLEKAFGDRWGQVYTGPQEIEVQIKEPERDRTAGVVIRTDLDDREDMLKVYMEKFEIDRTRAENLYDAGYTSGDDFKDVTPDALIVIDRINPTVARRIVKHASEPWN